MRPSYPDSGISQSPRRDGDSADTQLMAKGKKIQEVVAENVQRLRKAGVAGGFTTINELAKKYKIGNGTLQRVESGADYRISTLVGIAHMFGLEPWHLLVPDLDVNERPVLVSSRELQFHLELEDLIEKRRVADEQPTGGTNASPATGSTTGRFRVRKSP